MITLILTPYRHIGMSTYISTHKHTHAHLALGTTCAMRKPILSLLWTATIPGARGPCLCKYWMFRWEEGHLSGELSLVDGDIGCTWPPVLVKSPVLTAVMMLQTWGNEARLIFLAFVKDLMLTSAWFPTPHESYACFLWLFEAGI